MGLVVAKKLPIVEPIPIQDTVCSAGLVLVQDLGYAARFVLANKQTCYELGTEEVVVAAKIVLPYDVIWPGISRSLNFMTGSPGIPVKPLRLVKG